MSMIKTALVAASLVTFAAAAHADSREDLNSGYHGNTPVWSSPYGPRDDIEQGARGAYGQVPYSAPRYHPRARYQNHSR